MFINKMKIAIIAKKYRSTFFISSFIVPSDLNTSRIINYMVRGNFIGAAIVAIIYTVYILFRPLPTKSLEVVALVVLNALTIVLLSFAFK